MSAGDEQIERGNQSEGPRWLELGSFRLSEGISLAVLLMLATWMLTVSWAKWLEPIIDSGRDLYIPEQIALGHIKLYRDMLYYYPPLAPYFLAGIVKIFGSTLRLYVVISIMISTVTAGTLYCIGRSTTRNLAGAIAPVLLFVTWNLTSATSPGANWIFPNAYAATMAMMFFLLCLAALLKYVHGGRRTPWLMATLIFGLLAFWTKLEYAAFVVAIVVALAVLRRIPWRWTAAFFVSIVASLLLVNWYFSDAPPSRNWLMGNVLVLVRSSSGLFYEKVVGTARAENLALIVRGAVLTIVMVAALRLFDTIRARKEWSSHARLLALGAVSAVILVVSFALGHEHLFLRGWSLLQVLLVPWVLWLLWRRRDTPLLILLAFSLCATSRIAMRLTPEWYGYVFTLPVYLLIAYVLFRHLPDLGVYSLRTSLWWAPLIVLVALSGIAFQARVYGSQRYPVLSARGVFYDHDPGRAEAINGFLEWSRTHRASGLVVVPEGLTLNYLARIPDPTPYQTFTPIEIANPVMEKRILGSFETIRPELVIALTRDVTEFGYKGFGIDYARGIARYIGEHYGVVRTWRDSPRFHMTLMERRADSDPVPAREP